MQRCGAIVDAYSTGRFLADEFRSHDYKLVHIQSMAEILPFDRPYFRERDFVDNLVFEGREEETLARLKGLDLSFVIPGCESGVVHADRLAEALRLTTNGTRHSLARRQKDLMAATLEAAGLRAIAHLTTDRPEEARAWRAGLGKDEVVVKPVDSAGTEDVFFCRTDTEIEQAFRRILGKVNGMGHRNDKALVQERIRGDQYTANLVSNNGVHYLSELWTYHTREIPGAGSICELERLLDGSSEVRHVIQPYVFAVLDALGIGNGPTHVELFVDSKGPVLIELGARMQGSMSRTSTLAALGHDHVALTAMRYADPQRFAEYTRSNDPYRRRKHAVIVSLLSDREGTVVGFGGLEKVRQMESFSDAISFPAVGDTIAPTRDLASTSGIVYLVHDDEAVVERDRRILMRKSIDQIIDLAPLT